MVASPHHLGAAMNTDRKHRMTDLFGRLAARGHGGSGPRRADQRPRIDAERASRAYSSQARIQLTVRPLAEQIAAPARTILLVLMAAAAVVFVIACSNVANLILARSVRREGELALRAALGASRGALRRTLLAESLVLCAAGAGLGLLMAPPLVNVAGLCRALFRARARSHRATPACSGSAPDWRSWRPCCSPTFPASFVRSLQRARDCPAAACGSRRAPTAACGFSRPRRSRARSCCSRAPACWSRR